MKVNELITEAPMKAVSVQIKNKMGVYKKFKSFESPGAREWSQSWDETDKPKKVKPAKVDKPAKISDHDISGMADQAMSSALDGIDPADTLGNWMNKTGVSMDDIDRVVNKEQKIKGGLYAYIARSWQDMQADIVHDAGVVLSKGKKPESSEFYDVVNNKIVKSQNPWGSAK